MDENHNNIETVEEFYGLHRNEENKPKKNGEDIFEWLETFCLALGLMIILFLFIFKYVSVDGTSMTNTLQDEDKLIISNLSHEYKTGDVIVVRSATHNKPLVKRVIATEGQTVEIDFQTWTVRVDGVILDEPYVKRVDASMRGEENYSGPIVVEKNKVFVMGDNRNGSDDSRNPAIGQLEVRNVLGKVILRVFPFGSFGSVE